MKIKTIFFLLFTFLIQDAGITQVIKLDKLGERAKRRAEYRKRQKEDRAIDKGLDKLEGAFKKKKKKEDPEEAGVKTDKNGNIIIQKTPTGNTNPADLNETNGDSNVAEDVNPVLLKSYAKYDFVPGDKVIFYDDLRSEESGEFPMKWDIYKGSAENATLGEENVIQLNDRQTGIFPFMNDNENYLPEQFTIEFDIHFSTTSMWQNYGIKLYNKEYRNGKVIDEVKHNVIKIAHSKATMGDFGAELRRYKVSEELGWRRVSLSYNKGYLKVYVDEEKAISIPRLKFKPTMFSLITDHHPSVGEFCKVKNFRIAEGGDKIYNRISTDGKFVTNGINFDYNKATIKVSSLGVINQFVKMMEKYPELNFSVEGHTDSDGSEASNLELSSKRAAAVKAMLISKGIDGSRLKSVGKGEAFPLNENKTVEDKANNRRVEFVKL
jgi:flagellar motor protein MotB